MLFDPENKIVKLCALGMQREGQGMPAEAAKIFSRAWSESVNSLERFISAHYLARHQETVSGKLAWDRVALDHALQVKDEHIKSMYSSLYLNVAKCYEDLGDMLNAKTNYEMAGKFSSFLPGDGYGKMIRSGITNGLRRIN